ncbi:MAG: HNH endonuclease, partial [Polyangiaceae bacterium]
DCGQTRVDAAGQSHPVDDAFAAMADCDAQHLGDVDARPSEGRQRRHARPHAGARPPKRATQTIPPATRRQVLRRDRKRCVVPGCHNHRFVDLHHVTPRSEGGTHDPDQLATLCGAHHRAAHAGTLVLDGTATEGFTFRHADGTPYGSPLHAPEPADVAHRVFTGLTNMGFKQTDARRLIACVQAEGAPADVATFLRQALQHV